ETIAFLKQTDKNIRPNLDITIDDLPPALAFEAEGVWPGPGGLAEGMFVSMLYIIDLGRIPPGEHVFRMADKNFRAGELAWLSYWVHGGAGFRDIKISKDTRILTCRFSLERDIKVGPFKAQSGPAEPAPPGDTKIESSTLAGFVREKDLSVGVILLALGMAFVLGMTHALSPGHGKAMVAAYLIGSRGRIRDAVFLGGVVTLTHVLSVIILGLVILFLSQYIVPRKLFPWLGVGSGLLVFLVGYWMLADRAIGATDHGHEHHHTHDHHAPDHAHTHEHGNVHDRSQTMNGKTSLGGMLSLGVAGGMVPCPTALVVLLTAVAIHRIAFGLLLIAVFSLGLAVVLILIGILTVTAYRVTNFFSEQRKWIQLLPVFSAGAIMVIGVSIALNSLLSAGILTFNR
ncbi:MAG: sulfite exporter TauE/SafE family protein, partial [Thermodesulfobacteriota bacterium]|nr:sulfite exporter TauE/SafE family protein [Thermodesulfobacteriota bacterium]